VGPLRNTAPQVANDDGLGVGAVRATRRSAEQGRSLPAPPSERRSPGRRSWAAVRLMAPVHRSGSPAGPATLTQQGSPSRCPPIAAAVGEPTAARIKASSRGGSRIDP